MELLWSLLAQGRKWWTVTVVVLLLLIFLYRTELGFESSSGSIQRDLGSSFETPHFTIYFADSAFQRGEILWLAAEHEFRLDQINGELERSYEGRIQSYIYPSAEVKRRHVGAGNTSIAKPWSGEIHLHSPADVLKHELVHLAAAPFGVSVLRASIHPGLTEGLAMALEWDWGNRTLHEYSAGMIRAGLDPGMESIMSSPGFAGQSSSLSYVLAGSFCRNLIDRYGINDFTRLYATGNYEAVLGEALPELVAEWKTMLSAIDLDAGMDDVTDVYFRAPPIFGKTCARATAKKLAEARKQFAARQYEPAAASYHEAYVEGRSTEAFGGLLVSNLRLGRTSFILAAKDSVFRADTTARLLPLYLPMGDACWLEGRVEEARSLYEKTARANFSRSSLEGSLIRLHVLNDSLASGFRSYILSDQPDSVRITILDGILVKIPDHPLALYLRGRLLGRMGRYHEALRELDRANVLTIDSRLETGRLMAHGDALFRLKEFNNAIASYEKALRTEDSMALVHEIGERVARCRWFDGNNMPDALESAKGQE